MLCTPQSCEYLTTLRNKHRFTHLEYPLLESGPGPFAVVECMCVHFLPFVAINQEKHGQVLRVIPVIENLVDTCKTESLHLLGVSEMLCITSRN